MNREVTLTLLGLHSAADEENKLESQMSGDYFFKNGRHYVLAKEINDGVTSSIRLIFDEKSLSVKRSGEITTELFFEKGIRHESSYRTPFGVIPVQTETESYSVDLLGAAFGTIKGKIKYKLFVDGNPQSDAYLEFTIT